MKSKLIILAALIASSASAGTLLVSGDSNIGNGIDGSDGSSTVAGNATFFRDLLGSGTSVVFQLTTNTDPSETTSESSITHYYGTTLGDTVNQVTTVTSANLAGASLLISFLPDTAYTGAEMTAIQNFLNGGGTVLLTGEWGGFDATADANINALLSFLGNPMSLTLNDFDNGFTIGSGAQIQSTPFTAGVTSFQYAATTNVTGGTPIFETKDLSHVFMAYTGSVSTVPEPGTGLLVTSAALLAFGARRFLRK